MVSVEISGLTLRGLYAVVVENLGLGIRSLFKPQLFLLLWCDFGIEVT